MLKVATTLLLLSKTRGLLLKNSACLASVDSVAAPLRNACAATPQGLVYRDEPRPLAHHHELAQISRRDLLSAASASWVATAFTCSDSAAAAYTVTRVEPEEVDIYSMAQQSGSGSDQLRVLWVGAGDMKSARKGLFRAGNEVIAVDLLRPDARDLRAAKGYATEQGYRLLFKQGDATKLKFGDDTFDVVVCSMFLCQDLDPEVVVNEIRRVLKPNGRFGFYEHVEDIDKVIVGKVFGEDSIIELQAYPEMLNIMAGVVRKV